MKKIIKNAMLLLLVGFLTACDDNLSPVEDGNYRNQKAKEKEMMKTVKLSFGGDIITEYDEPLLRDDGPGTFVGLNVYRTKKDTEDAKEENYAWGMFEYKDGLSINVITGYTYRFEATILIEDYDKVFLKDRKYSDPFRLDDARTAGFDNSWSFELNQVNRFNYTYTKEDNKMREYLSQLSCGTAYVNVGGDLGSNMTNYRSMQYPRVKRFYGGNESFDPSLESTIEIPMEYKCFGLKIILESIPAGTCVRVSDIFTAPYQKPATEPEYFLLFPKDMSLNFNSEEAKEWEGIYSLNNLKQNMKDFKLRFTWDKGNGETENFDHSFTVEAKKKKVLKLNIDGEVNETKAGNIVFTNMDDELIEETPEEVTN